MTVTGDGMGQDGRVGFALGRRLLSSQEGPFGQRETLASALQQRELAAGGSYCLLLTHSKSRLP